MWLATPWSSVHIASVRDKIEHPHTAALAPGKLSVEHNESHCRSTYHNGLHSECHRQAAADSVVVRWAVYSAPCLLPVECGTLFLRGSMLNCSFSIDSGMCARVLQSSYEDADSSTRRMIQFIGGTAMEYDQCRWRLGRDGKDKARATCAVM